MFLKTLLVRATSWLVRRNNPHEPKLQRRLKHEDTRPGVLYAFQYSDMGEPGSKANRKKYFKVGKTINLEQRMRAYRTLHPNGIVYHTVTFPNMPLGKMPDVHHAERILHDILRMGGFHVKQEVFLVEPVVLKAHMDLVARLVQRLRATPDPQSIRRLLQ